MIIPTYNELYNGVLSDLNTKLGITIPLFGKVFLRALAAVHAGKLWLIYKFLAKVQKNIFLDTADPESMGGTLERFGRFYLGRDPSPGTAGIYTIDITGTIGGTIVNGTTFKTNDDSSSPNKLFIATADFTLIAPTGQIYVTALEVGTDSQLQAGDKMTATAPIPDVDSLAVVAAEVAAPIAA